MDESNDEPSGGSHRVIAKPAPKTKAERRAEQEQQRAAKAALKAAGDAGGGKGAVAHKPAAPAASKHAQAAPRVAVSATPRAAVNTKELQNQSKTVQLFSHLVGGVSSGCGSFSSLVASDIHPSIVLLGQRYANGAVRGSNARAVAMLSAFKDVVRDYTTPQGTALSRDLNKHLLPMIQFLIDCRPHSISMGNAIKYAKNVIANVPPDMSEAEAKARVIEDLDAFIQERIVVSAASIAVAAAEKITDNDVILTYGSSSLVEFILLQARAGDCTPLMPGSQPEAHGALASSASGSGAFRGSFQEGSGFTRGSFSRGKSRSFRVIVVDARPGLEGQKMAKKLSQAGIETTYVLLNGISYIMREVTKVLLGASAMMANGAALSRVGTALVAMMARSYNVPTLFCCETYKFSDRVQLDSIVHNELGRASELRGDGESGADDIPGLHFLNPCYDLTPIKYISLVVTEVGLIPPTSVPVLLRELTRKEERADEMIGDRIG